MYQALFLTSGSFRAFPGGGRHTWQTAVHSVSLCWDGVHKGHGGEQRKVLDQDKRTEESLVFFLEAVKFLARGRRGQGEPVGRELACSGASGQEGE